MVVTGCSRLPEDNHHGSPWGPGPSSIHRRVPGCPGPSVPQPLACAPSKPTCGRCDGVRWTRSLDKSYFWTKSSVPSQVPHLEGKWNCKPTGYSRDGIFVVLLSLLFWKILASLPLSVSPGWL